MPGLKTGQPLCGFVVLHVFDSGLKRYYDNFKSNPMKNGMHINPILFKMVVLVTCFMLVMVYNKSKATDSGTVYAAKVGVVR